ncbi:hypothetical protein [Nitrospirillum sp. BR 11163]|uniref:hypothetical protein n=1 Tax=Nitrospirillum sp. BR 11163 TaxID=3104323 RepID=UPI002AFE26F9|nr:hypothetical protein [Nitrospirillum sp. BR 11163]MEA1675308.1 hypothetical protein [Nitrospirillum sp. BR 11163]
MSRWSASFCVMAMASAIGGRVAGANPHQQTHEIIRVHRRRHLEHADRVVAKITGLFDELRTGV